MPTLERITLVLVIRGRVGCFLREIEPAFLQLRSFLGLQLSLELLTLTGLLLWQIDESNNDSRVPICLLIKCARTMWKCMGMMRGIRFENVIDVHIRSITARETN